MLSFLTQGRAAAVSQPRHCVTLRWAAVAWHQSLVSRLPAVRSCQPRQLQAVTKQSLAGPDLTVAGKTEENFTAPLAT